MDVSICGQLSSMEAISHNAVGRKGGRGSAAVGKRTKLFVRPFSAPLFKFTLCSALPRSLQESDEKQPESRGEGRENRESVQQRGLVVINDVFKSMQPAILLSSSFFNAKEKYATAHRESLPFSLFQKPWVCVCCAESICGTKDTDTPNGGHSLLRHSGCISIGKVHHPRAGLAR